ncbi:MAG: hypothetical protein U1F77_08750 [Kiritimatiellia bacterium]
MDELLLRHALRSCGVFWLNAPEDQLVRRLTGRRLCPSCGLLTQAGPPAPACPLRAPRAATRSNPGPTTSRP